MRFSSILTAAAAACALCACDGPASPTTTTTAATASPSASAAQDEDVLATVNGVPIREADVRLALSKGGGHEGKPKSGPERAKGALETLIRNELIRQRAVSLGLDADPSYLAKIRAMEAQLNQVKREALSTLFFRKQIAEKAKIGEPEARKYFDDNAARIKTETHLLQILVKGDEAKIAALKKEIDGGASFEEVAAKQFPAELPKGERDPWDLGHLKWNQLPEPWRPQLDEMKPGDVSAVIAGPKKRFWIIKLVERRQNDAITFEEAKPALMTILQASKTIELRKTTNAELRKKATIEYLRDPASAAKPVHRPVRED